MLAVFFTYFREGEQLSVKEYNPYGLFIVFRYAPRFVQPLELHYNRLIAEHLWE